MRKAQRRSERVRGGVRKEKGGKNRKKWRRVLDKRERGGKIRASPDEGTDLMRCLTDRGSFLMKKRRSVRKNAKKVKKAFDKCVNGARLSTCRPDEGRAGWT